jgi:hypothetical protein
MPRTEVDLVGWAGGVAETYLGNVTPRWHHVRAVGQLASVIGPAFGSKRDLLIAAGLLHDVGYAPALATTGFHPLDGARFLRSLDHDDVARLVAHHTGARHEARLRGITDFEEEFPFEDSALDRALTFCDVTVGPTGRRVRVPERVAEIRARYGPNHVVARAIKASEPEFEAAVVDTEHRVAEAGITLTGSLAYPE